MSDAEMTQAELDAIRALVAGGQSLPARLARTLLTDRDKWVSRAFHTAGQLDKARGHG